MILNHAMVDGCEHIIFFSTQDLASRAARDQQCAKNYSTVVFLCAKKFLAHLI